MNFPTPQNISGNKTEIQKQFPRSPPVNLNLRTVYNHMDIVIMCSDWDPDPPNILKSVKVMFYTVSYMIAISKLGAVRLCHLQGRRLFSGGKFTEVCHSDFFFSSQALVFQSAMWRRVDRTDGRADTSPRGSPVFFSSYKLPKTVL